LLERLKVLALLHWGAPRPLSRAERDFSHQLEVWEEQQREAALGWAALKKRMDAMVAQRQQEQQQQPPAAGAAAARALGLLRGRVLGLAAAPRVLLPTAATPSPQQGNGAARRLGGAAPEEQMGKLYAALAAQREAIAAGGRRLDVMREDLRGYLEAHPEAALPASLRQLSGALSSLR